MQEAITKKNKIYTAIYNESALSEQTPVVLIRGLGRVIEHWHGFEEKVAAGHPAIVFDNKGMGRSTESLDLSATISDFAEHLIEVLDHWKADKAHLVGISLGGMIAIETAKLFPKRVSSFCAINSSANFRAGMRLSLSGIYVFTKHGVTRGNSDEALFDAMVASNSPEEKRQYLKEWSLISDKYGLNGYSTFCQLKAALFFGASKSWERIEAPGLIVVGGKDRLVPPGNSNYLARKLPNAELLRIPYAGHELLMDAGDEFLKHYSEFLRAI